MLQDIKHRGHVVVEKEHTHVEQQSPSSLSDVRDIREFVRLNFPLVCPICRDQLRYEFEIDLNGWGNKVVTGISAYTYWQKESRIKRFWHKFSKITRLLGFTMLGVSLSQIVISIVFSTLIQLEIGLSLLVAGSILILIAWRHA